jgi:hypothetical protein
MPRRAQACRRTPHFRRYVRPQSGHPCRSASRNDRKTLILIGFAAVSSPEIYGTNKCSFFRPNRSASYEHMFFASPKETEAAMTNAFYNGLDLVVDFATLGEYRVVTGAPVREVEEADLWATDVDWKQPERATAQRGCSLPRARDRKLARAIVNG